MGGVDYDGPQLCQFGDECMIITLAILKLRLGMFRPIRRRKATITWFALLCLAGVLASSRVIMAQDPIPVADREPASVHGGRRFPRRPVADSDPGLPIWHYDITSPVNGASYSGYMVGSDPF